jgi:hypothetical protein
MGYFERETVTVAAVHPGTADDSRVRLRSLRLRAAREAKARMAEDHVPMQEFRGVPYQPPPPPPTALMMTDECPTLRTDHDLQRELITDPSVEKLVYVQAPSYQEPPPPSDAAEYYPPPAPSAAEYYPPPVHSEPAPPPPPQERFSQARSYPQVEAPPPPPAQRYPAPDSGSEVKLFDPPPAVYGDMAMNDAQPIALTAPLPAYREQPRRDPEPEAPHYRETSVAPMIARGPSPMPLSPMAPAPSPWPVPVRTQPVPVQPQYLPAGYARPMLEQTHRTERGPAMRFISIGFAVVALVLLVAGSSALYSFLSRPEAKAAPPAPVPTAPAKVAKGPGGIPEVDVMHLPKVGTTPVIPPPIVEEPAPAPAPVATTAKASTKAGSRRSERVREEKPREAAPVAEEEEAPPPPKVAAKGPRVKTGKGSVVVPALPKWGAARRYSDDDEPATGGLFLDQRTLSGIKGLDKAFSAD